MKILYVTTIGGTISFFRKTIEELIRAGHRIDIACNDSASKVPDFYRELGCKIYSIQTSRAPLKKGNLIAIQQLKKIVKEKKYDIVHCHTPIAAMCSRLACRKIRKQGVRIIYTAHGFHFYKGAPLKNWVFYYPIEKICSRWTDVLITINKEDFAFAQKKMNAGKIEYVPGVGIELEKKLTVINKKQKRRELGIPENVKLLLSVGELNKNKNHEIVIKSIIEMKDLYYIIAGQGPLREHLMEVINKYGMAKRVKLLGFRNDIAELCEISDAFVFPSFREGLSVSVMEAMASGMPVVCSQIRGNVDLIDEKGGILFDPKRINSCKYAIEKLFTSDMQKFGLYNKEKIKRFSIDRINKKMFEIYEKAGYNYTK